MHALASITKSTDDLLGAVSSIAADPDKDPGTESLLRFSLAATKEWSTSIQMELLPKLRRGVFDSYRVTIKDLANKLAARPSIEAFINDRVFLADRVKRHLLAWPGRALYSKTCVEMSKAISNAKSQHTQFQLKPPLLEDPMLCRELQDAEELFKSAKHLIRIIAAASVVLERKAEDKPHEAKKLLEDPKAAFPKALLLELQKARDGELAIGGRPPKRRKMLQNTQVDSDAELAMEIEDIVAAPAGTENRGCSS